MALSPTPLVSLGVYEAMHNSPYAYNNVLCQGIQQGGTKRAIYQQLYATGPDPFLVCTSTTEPTVQEPVCRYIALYNAALLTTLAHTLAVCVARVFVSLGAAALTPTSLVSLRGNAQLSLRGDKRIHVSF